jgi:CubicO group peptidase (beta-lactamase class C family)
MLASISKTITATALMQLYEQGYFDLDDPINDYLPFQVSIPRFPKINITFRMLLTHTSSIRDNWYAMISNVGDSDIPLGEYLEDYLTPGGELYFRYWNFYHQKPGTDWHYSNMAATLAGYLVEVISGMPFDEYCEINIFEPLDMDETAWFLADLNSSHIAVPYHWNGRNFIPYPHYGYAHYPCGQLRTSVIQLSHFLLMMMNHGEYNSTRILKESTVDLMLTPQIPSYMMTFPPEQGIIWYQNKAISGRTLWGHSGGDPGVATFMFFEPETNIGVIILTNADGSDSIRILFQAIFFVRILSALFTFIETTNTPYPPTIHGSTDGKVEQSYSYTVNTTTPNGDDVYYFIDWGDNTNSSWIGPYSSGEVITESHTWSEKGKYTIKAKVKDIDEWESDWATLTVTMPYSYNKPMP